MNTIEEYISDNSPMDIVLDDRVISELTKSFKSALGISLYQNEDGTYRVIWYNEGTRTTMEFPRCKIKGNTFIVLPSEIE